MQYISLNNSSLTYFIAKGELSELSGSSRYNVFDSEIVTKEKPKKNRIENKTAIQDYLQHAITDKMADSIINRLLESYSAAKLKSVKIKHTSEKLLDRIEALEHVINMSEKYSSEMQIKLAHVRANIAQTQSRYQKSLRTKKLEKRINKSKAKAKMYALFNLSCSRKFIAFYSVSFPAGTSDNQAFDCWNSWLTALRKRFHLQNYIWVTERQKNGTLHYHMLTNNYMPILSINRAMAIIINNKVNQGLISWGNSSLNRYNGVDVDSVFNSKRHKKTGRILNPSELRNWLVKYITKYVTKNTDKFLHLSWHCSRSVSSLFCSTIILIEESRLFTDWLPYGYSINGTLTEEMKSKYYEFKSDFNRTLVFKFVPPNKLYEKIRAYNDFIFADYVPNKSLVFPNINYKTKKL